LDQLISISDEVKRRNLNALPIKPNKVTTVHLGINLDYYRQKLSYNEKLKLKKQLNLPINKLLIGLPGRLSPSKGHDTFIKAVTIIQKTHSDIAYVIIGGLLDTQGADIRYINVIKSLISSNNLLGCVYFTGFQTDIPSIIECLDIACIPSYDEAFGLTVIETMAMNTPLVATNAGGIPELLTDKKDGLLFLPKNPENLAEKLIYFINNKQQRTEYAEKALKTVSKKFSQENHIKKITAIYKKLLNE
jgi:glycosyltransferase involved in cell wall biosynthesis